MGIVGSQGREYLKGGRERERERERERALRTILEEEISI